MPNYRSFSPDSKKIQGLRMISDQKLYLFILDSITTNISEHLIILINVSDQYRKLLTLKYFYTLYKLCCKGWCLHMRMCKGHSKLQSQRRKFLTPKILNNQGLYPSESVLIIFKRVPPLLLCPHTLWWPGMFPRSFCNGECFPVATEV